MRDGEGAVRTVARRGIRNPQSTREAILDAARGILAGEGIEGLSVSAVAEAANVNRGTAYMHFESREALVAETIASVSEILLRSVYGEDAWNDDIDVEAIDHTELTGRIASFAMDNPDLCKVWLLQVIASSNPSADAFWRKFLTCLQGFVKTPRAQQDVDAEVLSVLVLAGSFLWPIWSHAGSLDEAGKRAAAQRFSRELTRLSAHGSMRP